jgi:hypothetical protein
VIIGYMVPLILSASSVVNAVKMNRGAVFEQSMNSMTSRIYFIDAMANAIEEGDAVTVQSLLDSGSVDVNARLPRVDNPSALVHAAIAPITSSLPRQTALGDIVNVACGVM